MSTDEIRAVSPEAKRITLEGVVSLLLTPFHQDGSINWDAYERYVDWQLSMGPDGIFAVCGSSEMHWLAFDERIALAKRAVRRAGSTPVLATANLDPDASVHRDEVMRMADTGVAGVVLVPQSNLSVDVEGHIAYFLELIDAANVPVFLYEWPQVEHYLLPQKLVAQLAPYVSGIKDTTCTLEGIGSKIDVSGEMAVYQANTPFLAEAIALGARGYVAITSTCWADLAIEAWEALKQGEKDRGRTLHRDLVYLDSLLVRAYPATAKYAVASRGIDMELHTRWPVKLQNEHVRALDVWIDQAKSVSETLGKANGR